MLQRPLSRSAYLLFSLLLIVAATSIALRVAITTRFDTHPDEVSHADAFCYFESRWWPPPLGAQELRYNPYGMSRVDEQEVIYILFGKMAALLRPIVEPWFATDIAPQGVGQLQLFLPSVYAPNFCFPAYYTYRLLNVALLPLTLGIAFWVGLRYRWAASIGLMMVAIPQVIYIYAYANSDAWGFFLSVALLSTALVYHDRAHLTMRDALWFGLLIGLMLLSKSTFWITIVIASLILAHKGFQIWQTERATFYWLLRWWIPMSLLLAFLLILPLKIIFPLSQGNYAAAELATRERMATPTLRPSHPTDPGYLLRERGVPFRVIWANPEWWRPAAESFYAVFGYWKLYAPTWVYLSATCLLLLGVACTCFDFIQRRAAYSSLVWLMLLVAPLVIVAIVFASLIYSWTFALQPQGRHLLSAVLPLALLVGGAVDNEPRWLRPVRVFIWSSLLALSLYTLWELLRLAPTWS